MTKTLLLQQSLSKLWVLWLALAFAFLSACSQGDKPANFDYGGDWKAVAAWGERPGYFDLTISEKGSELSGSHEAGLDDASRIDSSGGEISVHGSITGDKAQITIRSGYAENVEIQGTLTPQGNGTMIWQAAQTFNAENYIPASATLERANKSNQTADHPTISHDQANFLAQSIDSTIQSQKLEPSLQNLKGVEGQGQVLVYREGDALLKMGLSMEVNSVKTSVDFYFGPKNQLELAKYTGNAKGLPNSVFWYFSNGKLIAAKTDQGLALNLKNRKISALADSVIRLYQDNQIEIPNP